MLEWSFSLIRKLYCAESYVQKYSTDAEISHRNLTLQKCLQSTEEENG